jgi:phage terminase Nu1 subunit (DNA packaging protein)
MARKPRSREGAVMAAVVPITNGNGPTITEGRRRILAAQARRLELRAGREAGELVEVRVVELRWSRLIIAARNRLLSIPNRAMQLLPHLSRADMAVLDRLIREVLEELADRTEEADE